MQPQIVFKIGFKLGRNETGLGKELRRAFAQKVQVPGLVRIEDNDRLGAPAAVFRRAEGQNINAAPPGHLCGTEFKGDQGVGKAGAIHMQRQIMFAADCGNVIHFGCPVDRADFGCLR